MQDARTLRGYHLRHALLHACHSGDGEAVKRLVTDTDHWQALFEEGEVDRPLAAGPI